MLITNIAQYTCHKTFIWSRVSLTCAGEGAIMFAFDKSTSLEGGDQEKNPEMIRGGGGLPKNERKKQGNDHSPPSR